MTVKKRKKKKKGFPWVLAAVLVLLLAAAVGTGIFFSRNAIIEGEVVSTDVETLDLRGTAELDVEAILRLQSLKELDIRGVDVSDETLERLRAALPACVIRYDIPVGELRYDPGVTNLTLPDLPDNWENLRRLRALQSLQIERCTKPAAMAELAASLPNCRTSWNLGLGGEWFDVTSTALDIPGEAVYFEELRDQLGWFTALESVRLPGAALSHEQQRTLLDSFPAVDFYWSVAIGEMRVACDAAALTFTPEDAVDLSALSDAMERGLLPALASVDFSGSTVPAADRIAFREAHDELAVSWTVRILEQTYSCDVELLDFSGAAFTQEGLDELEEAMAYLPALQQVEMHNTGLTNEALDALNKKYPDVKVVWTVRFGYNNFYTLRTDATYFRPSEFGVTPPDVSDADTPILAYCTEMRGLDLGHQKLTDLSFLTKMPHLTYLIVAECPVSDLTPLSKLQELAYLEIFSTDVTDLSPLAKCAGLRALNCCYIKAKQDGAWSALNRMKDLEYLWYCNCPLSADQMRQLSARENLTTFFLRGGESSGGTWRYSQYYYDMRKLMNAPPMPGGTNGVDPENPSTQIIIDDAGQKFYLENFDMSQYWWTEERYSMYHPYIIGLTG